MISIHGWRHGARWRWRHDDIRRPNELRLLHMRALVNDDELTGYHVEHEHGVIRILNDFGSGWNFFDDEYGSDVSCETLQWIKMVELVDTNERQWDVTNPDRNRVGN